MKRYYLNKRPLSNNYFYMHKAGCPFLGEKHERIFLGNFESCHEAIKLARKISTRSNGCYFCLKECCNTDNIAKIRWRTPVELTIEFSKN